jgi:hypothetical protein
MEAEEFSPAFSLSRCSVWDGETCVGICGNGRGMRGLEEYMKLGYVIL